MSRLTKQSLRQIPVSCCDLLRRNPQYLTSKQMEALKLSITRDGFLVPIVVRTARNGRYEIVSGNHRFLAACELGIKTIPAVVVALNKRDSMRIAVNLNTVHGELQPQLLAPFLSEMTIETLTELYLPDKLIVELVAFDTKLANNLIKLEAPDVINIDTPKDGSIEVCICPTCGRRHMLLQSK